MHNFVHNSATWQIVVGKGVMVGHPSTNHNSPRGQVVHKVVHKGVAPELLQIISSRLLQVVIGRQKSYFISKFKLEPITIYHLWFAMKVL